MRILFFGLNFEPEPIGIGPYSTGLCRGLVDRGHRVIAITGKPYYPNWRKPEGSVAGWTRDVIADINIIRCPLYVPKNPSGKSRLAHHASFAISAIAPMAMMARRFKPDLIFSVAPSLASAPVGRLAARIAGAMSWLHVQDFEVEAAFKTGLLDPASGIGGAVRKLERRLLDGFDLYSSISGEMCDRLARSGIAPDRIVEFRNWANALSADASGDTFRKAWNITTPHVALYSGNIANKQGIEIIIDAAKRLCERRDLTFVVCGSGPYREKLVASAEGLPNIQFRDLQPIERLPELLALATVHLLPQKAEAVGLVLPSKLTNILASGRPVVVTAPQDSNLAHEVNGCGIATPPGDGASFVAAISAILDDRQMREDMGIRAIQRVRDRWHREVIIDRLEQEIKTRLEAHRLRRT